MFKSVLFEAHATYLHSFLQEFHSNVMSKADIIQATGESIAIFQEVQCLTPRYVGVFRSFSM